MNECIITPMLICDRHTQTVWTRRMNYCGMRTCLGTLRSGPPPMAGFDVAWEWLCILEAMRGKSVLIEDFTSKE